MTSRRVFLSWAGVAGAGLAALLTAVRQPSQPPAAEDVYLDVYPTPNGGS